MGDNPEADGEVQSDDNTSDVIVSRDVQVTESVTVKSKRGTGTRDQDEVRTFREVSASVDPDELDLSLIGQEQTENLIDETRETFEEVRAIQPDEEESED